MAHNEAMPSPTQIALLAAIGAVLWFLAALLMRAIAPMPWYEGAGIALVYALVIPGTLPFILLSRKLAGLHKGQTAMGILVVTATALLLDGIAFAFFPALYADNPADTTQAAAAILWGAGVGLVLAFIFNKGETA
jgi:hypothetical protein